MNDGEAAETGLLMAQRLVGGYGWEILLRGERPELELMRFAEMLRSDPRVTRAFARGIELELDEGSEIVRAISGAGIT